MYLCRSAVTFHEQNYVLKRWQKYNIKRANCKLGNSFVMHNFSSSLNKEPGHLNDSYSMLGTYANIH